MKKTTILGLVIMALVLAASAIYAVDAPDKIKIDDVQKKKPAVDFNHKAHVTDLEITCVTCHHKTEEGQTPKPCFECHKAEKQGDTPEFKDAMHDKCKTCHKKKGGDAPVKCNDCHKKTD